MLVEIPREEFLAHKSALALLMQKRYQHELVDNHVYLDDTTVIAWHIRGRNSEAFFINRDFR